MDGNILFEWHALQNPGLIRPVSHQTVVYKKRSRVKTHSTKWIKGLRALHLVFMLYKCLLIMS